MDKDTLINPVNKAVADSTANEALTVMIITAIVSWLSENVKCLGIEIHVETMVVIVTGLVSGITRGFIIWLKHQRNKEKVQQKPLPEIKKKDIE